jgi:hypothetical protein
MIALWRLFCTAVRHRLGEGIESPIFIFCAICISRLCPVTSAFSTIESSTHCINSSSAEPLDFPIVFHVDSSGTVMQI